MKHFTNKDLAWAKQKLNSIVAPMLPLILHMQREQMIDRALSEVELRRLMKKVKINPPKNWPKS